jgi:hypothetical protein
MFELQPPFASRTGQVDSEYFNELQVYCEKNLTYRAQFNGFWGCLKAAPQTEDHALFGRVYLDLLRFAVDR